MDIQYFCPRWGSENLSWRDFFEKAREAGYDGVEWAIPLDTTDAELDRVLALSLLYRMPLIAQHFDSAGPDFSVHVEQYQEWLEKIAPYKWLTINTQSGKDYFNFEQNKRLISMAIAYTQDLHIPLVHETHRGKFSYAAQVTKDYLAAIAELRLTLDVSHWVCVSESLLADQAEALSLALERSDHIHARIGYTQGPQVPDPRQPEWQETLDFHLGCWDKIVALKQAQGEPLTITTEFGPFPYNTQPAADHQWVLNTWLLKLLKERYPA